MKKNSLFFVFATLVAGVAMFVSCQKAEIVNNEDSLLFLKSASGPLSWTDVCADGTNDLVLTLVGSGNRQIQQLIDGNWVNFASVSSGATDLVGTLENVSAGTYYFRYKVGSGGFTQIPNIVIEECCTPGFIYIDNKNGTYTFTLVPEDDVEGALLEFTFAQGVAIEGLTGFTRNGNPNDPKSSVWSATMDLNECETLTWTVSLAPDCTGNSNNSNVWTDFKVNDDSKKDINGLANIVIPCL